MSARSEMVAGRYDFAANRAYYACFYAASAVLLAEGHKFVKHTGLRGAVHQHLVKAGRLDPEWGRAYDRIFQTRQMADYLELAELDEDQAAELFRSAEGSVAEMKRLMEP